MSLFSIQDEFDLLELDVAAVGLLTVISDHDRSPGASCTKTCVDFLLKHGVR